MTDFRELSARERVEPVLTARIEQLAHPNNTFAAAARAKELLDQLEADARRPVEAERDALASDLAELTASKQHGAFISCGHHVQTVTMEAFGRKIAEKRQALAERDQAVQDAQGFLDRATAAEAQVARIRAFLEDMAGWCSPHGVAADYAKRGLDALDGIDPLDAIRGEQR